MMSVKTFIYLFTFLLTNFIRINNSMLLSKSKSVALGDRSFTDYGKMKNRDFSMKNDKHWHFKSASLSIIPESN